MRLFYILFFLVFSLSLEAQVLTAKKIDQVIDVIKADHFTYLGKKKLFSYISTKSCVYLGKTSILIKNYCEKDEDYPAKSITLVSHEFGIIEFYEQKEGYHVRRISLSSFPEHLEKDLPKDLSVMNIDSIDQFLEENYYQYLPACWSFQRTQPDAEDQLSCHGVDANDYRAWLEDSFFILEKKSSWDRVYNQLLNSI